jgi:glycolate dehydrogenase FAD-binding subunit
MSSASTTSHSRLADLVGASRVVTEPAQLTAYEIDGLRPSAALRPESRAQIPEIIKFAASEKLGVIAAGGRTKLSIGLPPKRYDLALDMSGLNKIIAYDPGDLTLSVEAGVPLVDVGRALAEHRQFLPLAVPFLKQTTIGGIIASGVDGPLRQFYGTARDFLLGMEFVTGQGVAAKSGGRVVKNVTGYDIHKLMIGALGSLGVITSLNFKTFPLPISPRGFIARFPTAAQACDMRNRVAKSQLTPITLDILSPSVAKLFESEAASGAASAPMPSEVLSHAEWTLTTGYAGSEKVLARYAADLQRIAAEAGATGTSVLGENLNAAWARKREFIPIALASSPATTIVKISVMPARMNEVLAAAQSAAETNPLPWAALARGLGIIYFALLPNRLDDEEKNRVENAARAIHEVCAKLGGQSTIPWCPTAWKSNLNIWGPENSSFAQMQKIKTVFDPEGVLSPGRYVGGL